MNEELVAEFVAGCQKQALEFVESGRSAKRVTISKISRDLIYQSIGKKCPTCDLTLSEPSDRKSTKSYDPIDSSITVEHLLPLDLGGNNSFNNLVPMCYSCNAKARGATQQEFVEALIKENRGKDLSEENKDILNRFVEWSIRTVKSPDNKIDSEFQQYFEVVRKAPRASPTTGMVRIILVERKIAELEVRIQALENTLWKRTMRSIGSFFQRVKSPINAVEKASIEKKASKPQKGDSHKVEKASIEKQAPQPQKENPHNPDFTPEEFSSAILQMSSTDESEFFGTSYGFLLEKQPRFNLSNYNISPNEYLLLHCSIFLEIEDRPDALGQNHYWISPKKKGVGTKTSVDASKIIENSRKTAEKKSQEKSAEIRRKSANTNTHAIQNSKSVFDLAKWLEENWRGESTYPKLSKVILAHEEENKGNRTLKDILKEDFDIPKRWTMAQKTEHWNRLMHSESFRQLIFEIFSENETDRLSLSALGVRLNRKTQDEGYQNSKEYFQSVHGSRMTISDALNRYFTNEEIRFTGIPQLVNGTTTMKYTHVELHRRN